MLFFNISGDDFRGRSKTALFRVKFRRCAEVVEKLRIYPNTVKLTDRFILCFFFRLMVKYLKSGSRKINYDFLKMPHKELSQNFSWHSAGWRSVSQKYNVIRSPDQYPCMFITRASVPRTGKKTLSTNLLELQEFDQHSLYPAAKACVTQFCTDYCSYSFPYKIVSFPHKIILTWSKCSQNVLFALDKAWIALNSRNSPPNLGIL